MHVETQSVHHDTPYTRLFQWFGLSLLFHIALITFVGGVPPVLPHRPLVVDLQHIPPAATDPMTTPVIAPDTASDMAVENPLPQAPAPDAANNALRPPAPPRPLVDLPVPFESYLNIDEVDVRAEPANDVPLPYPMVAYMQRTPGVVRLHLFINEQGQLDRIELLDASPKGIFEKTAIDTVSNLYFYPATRFGRPVKSRKTIEVVFDPNPELDRPKPRPLTPSSSATEK